ncbi:MAG: hypothetical protein RLZZ292_2260 [Bacteroidota bacterium]|jgi:hypothetical protein
MGNKIVVRRVKVRRPTTYNVLSHNAQTLPHNFLFMKKIFQKWVIVPFLCWASYAYTQTTSDTLVANISDRARIYFIGQSKEDFKEIEKYDLNIVFKTLQQQAQNKKVKLSATQAEELRNDAFLTKKPKNSFWKKTHFNFYVGAVGGFSSEYLVYNKDVIINKNTPKEEVVNFQDYARFSYSPRLNFGIGLFREKKILGTSQKSFILRYGLGYQRLLLKPSYENSGYGFFKNGINIFSNITNPKDLIQSDLGFVDTIRGSYSGNFHYNVYLTNAMHYLTFEFIPTFRTYTTEGKTKWEIGAGIRGGIGTEHGFVARLYPSKIYSGFITIPILYTPQQNYFSYYSKYNYTFVVNVGYKYAKFFAEYHPHAFNLISYYNTNNTFSNASESHQALWSVGLRFGK